jgi:hypothetical protein
MADNIKIVGNIINTTTVSRYSSKDTNLIQSRNLQENFGENGDYIEFYTYDAGNNLLNTSYNYLNYKLPVDTGLTPGTSNPPNTTGNIQTTDVGVVSTLAPSTSSLYPIIEIDPVGDLQNIGYSSGEFNVRYNLFHNKISNYANRALFVKEISPDRTEIRLASTTLTNDEIETTVTSMIDEIDNSNYYVDYLLNFGNNQQYVAVNIALNKVTTGYEILFKLYTPLPQTIQEKQTLWVVEEKVSPYIFDVNLDKLITLPPGPRLRGPNFDISIPNQGTISTTYNTYSNLVTNLQSLQQTSYHQILNLMATQSVDINIDYTDYSNFVFFGSAYQRLSNFYTKAKQIEDYNTLINTYSPLSASTPSLITEISSYQSNISTLVSQFDGYESYLYFESGSYTWPKSGSLKPYALLSTGSAEVLNWYPALTGSAKDFDENNYDNLEFAIPVYIRDDVNNAPFLTFLNMVGHYFDNIWIYLKSITDINLANNNLEAGISKDLVYERLKSLGVHLYNSQAGEDVDQYLIGANTGSNIFDNDFSITGSYLNNVPRKDLLSELYKRIYHNLPLLVKTKGTVSGLEHLVTTFGITSSILNVKEFGGSLKSNLINGYNNDKVRIVANTITSSILSPLLSLQTFPTASSAFRENDMHYVDVSFSPETQMDTYISGAIASNNTTWSLDDYIGDPRQQYSGSYPDLDNQRKLYFETGVPGFAPFTASALDYNGFIRLIQYFDNALFKMLEDFTPERTSLSTGVTINSPVLERNKVVYSVPSAFTQSVYEAEYQTSSISSQYGHFYDALQNDKKPYFDGALSGSTVDVHQYFVDNYNPYLSTTSASVWSVWNAQHNLSQSINSNSFLHSDWNVLLNNVSKNVSSRIRKDIEYISGTTGSITSSAELQDSYLTLRSYQISRYEGSKLTSLLYNTYTTGSYTGSNGFTIQTGDISYGKTAAIDHQSYKVGWVKNIPSVSLNFYDKTQIQLKYLVDSNLKLTDLTLKNNNLVEVQNTFKSGEKVVLSLSDTLKPSFQKTLDGTKTIYRGGYSFDPILFRERSENLTFRYIDYNSVLSSFQGIRTVDNNWFTYNVNGTAIYKQTPIRGAYPDGIGSLTLNNNSYNPPFGFRWVKNAAESLTTLTTGYIGEPMTDYKYSYPSWNTRISVYSPSQAANNSINFNVPSTVPYTNFPSGSSTYNNSANRNVYRFDLIKFNQSDSATTYNTFDQDITNEGNVIFKAPHGGVYRIKAQIPFIWRANSENLPETIQQWQPSIGIALPTQITVPNPAIQTDPKYALNHFGYNIKIVGILEASTILSDNDNDWRYIGSTKITQVRDDSGIAAVDPISNTISIQNELPSATFAKGIFINTLDVDGASPSQGYIEPYLNPDEYLRFRFYIIDTNSYFQNGSNAFFEIGTNRQTSGTPTIPDINHSLIPETFFEISDINVVTPAYNTTTTIYSSSLFDILNNQITFRTDLSSLASTASIFLPSSESSTANYYSPVIDQFGVQVDDLIRFGSITNPRPDYYTVTSVTSSLPPGSPNANGVLSIRSYFSPFIQRSWTTVNTERRSVISLANTPAALDYFQRIASSPTRTFTVSGLTGTFAANNKTYTIPGPLYISQTPDWINIAVSDNILTGGVQTIPIAAGVSPTVILGVTLWIPNSDIITPTFTAPQISITPLPFLNVTVDRNITTGSLGSYNQNFAILRPKPDETSVIVNFRKSLGDVSQTILIPQDASDLIKANVGKIYQSLNTDLSNNTIQTQ